MFAYSSHTLALNDNRNQREVIVNIPLTEALKDGLPLCFSFFCSDL